MIHWPLQVFLSVLLMLVIRKALGYLYHRNPLISLPGPPPDSWLTGNISRFYHEHASRYHHELFAKYGKVMKIPSLFGTEFIYLSDLVAIRHIFTEQQVFDETRNFITVNSFIFGPGLLTTMGDAHKKHRKMLNPLFSPNNMRRLHPIMDTIANKMRDSVVALTMESEKEIDMAHWASRAAVEIIGKAGFGHSFDELRPTGGRQHRYTKLIKKLPVYARKLVGLFAILPLIDQIVPRWILRRISERLSWKALQEVMEIVDVMHETSLEVYAKSKSGIDATVIDVEQKDILSVLLKNNLNVSQDDRLEEAEIIGQMSSFIFAGSDTSSNAIARILHLLATHPDAQNRLRAEIVAAKATNGVLDYDQLINLEYLDAIVRETLRVYSPVPFLARETKADAILPLGTPIRSADGHSRIAEISIPKHTQVIIAIEAINRDKEIWGPDAEEWKPDRWLSPLPQSVSDAHVPAIYPHIMTFFGGNRACIGISFSLLEIKTVISKLVGALEFRVGNKEVVWLMSTIITPAVEGDEERTPYLPLNVSAVPSVKAG